MLRNAIIAVVLLSFFSNISVANTTTNDALAKIFTKAQLLASQGKTKEAIVLYHSLIIDNPLLPEAYNNLAALYLKQNNTKQAKYILEQGLHAHKGYGVLYESLTAINMAMARESYSKALQIDLKPSAIEIASLSLGNTQHIKKSTIVISKVKTATKPLVVAREIQRKKIVTKPKQASNIKDSKEIEQTLQAWSAAWSAQAVGVYLSFYHNLYRPTNGLSRKGWVQSRRLRLKKPRWITVALSNIVIKQNTGKQAVVNFKQTYRSNSLQDVSKKQLVLLHTNEGWRIFREKSI